MRLKFGALDSAKEAARSLIAFVDQIDDEVLETIGVTRETLKEAKEALEGASDTVDAVHQFIDMLGKEAKEVLDNAEQITKKVRVVIDGFALGVDEIHVTTTDPSGKRTYAVRRVIGKSE